MPNDDKLKFTFDSSTLTILLYQWHWELLPWIYQNKSGIALVVPRSLIADTQIKQPVTKFEIYFECLLN